MGRETAKLCTGRRLAWAGETVGFGENDKTAWDGETAGFRETNETSETACTGRCGVVQNLRMGWS